MTGSGKTTRARALADRYRRAVAYDPVGEWGRFPGWHACASLRDLVERMRRSWHGFRLAYQPRRMADLEAELHGLATIAWQAQAPYPECGPLLLVADELHTGYPVTKLRRALDGMPRLVMQGRHRGVSIIGISQRPALVSMDFRGNVARSYVFMLAAQQDRAAMLQLMGRQHAAELARLRAHQFLEASAGTLRRGANPPR